MALFHVDFFSNVLGMMMNMDVIIPQGTAPDAKYKTLYLLHGMSDDHTVWQRRTSIERYADAKRIAVVMPTTHLAWYTDTAYGMKYYTYIAKELPKICRDFFPKMSDRREDNFVAGLSMGGYGALKTGLLDSESFSAVGALSSAPDIRGRVGRSLYFKSIFGEDAVGSDNDLYAAAERLAASDKPKPKIYMCCGTEDGLMEENKAFYAHLEKLGFDLKWSEGPGNHEWGFWDRNIKEILDWLDI